MIRSLRILTLDDDPTMQALFSIAFRNQRVQLRMAENEAEAQRLIENEPPDLLLVDFCLGQKNGVETAESVLQSVHKKIPIIVVTAETSGALQEYVNSGRCLGYLFKPICLSTFGADVLGYVDVSKDEVAYLPNHPADSVRPGRLALTFLERALTQAHDLYLLPDSDLLEGGTLAQAAHRWVGTSGIDCMPAIETEARELEKCVRSRDSEKIPDIRRLLAEITGKFEGAFLFQSCRERR